VLLIQAQLDEPRVLGFSCARARSHDWRPVAPTAHERALKPPRMARSLHERQAVRSVVSPWRPWFFRSNQAATLFHQVFQRISIGAVNRVN